MPSRLATVLRQPTATMQSITSASRSVRSQSLWRCIVQPRLALGLLLHGLVDRALVDTGCSHRLDAAGHPCDLVARYAAQVRQRSDAVVRLAVSVEVLLHRPARRRSLRIRASIS